MRRLGGVEMRGEMRRLGGVEMRRLGGVEMRRLGGER